MSTSIRSRRTSAGFTLLEVIFTVVMLAILAKFAMMKLVTPATMTLPAQAQSLADVIRRAQSLAVVRGERTRVTATPTNLPLNVPGSVAVACPAIPPCNTDTSLRMEQGAVLAGASGVFFNSLGQPLNVLTGAALTSPISFTLSYATGGSTATYTVTVAQLTGRVSISP
jgi:prepilin-type N-terminal cleavage/methylation domain-containing protein